MKEKILKDLDRDVQSLMNLLSQEANYAILHNIHPKFISLAFVDKRIGTDPHIIKEYANGR